MSFTSSGSVPDVGLVSDFDIVRFIPTATGADTAGTFELYFDGSDVGHSIGADDINAVSSLSNGELLISKANTINLGSPNETLLFKSEDLMQFTSSSLGADTAGTYDLYLDGSDIGLRDLASNEDWENTCTVTSYPLNLSARPG